MRDRDTSKLLSVVTSILLSVTAYFLVGFVGEVREFLRTSAAILQRHESAVETISSQLAIQRSIVERLQERELAIMERIARMEAQKVRR